MPTQATKRCPVCKLDGQKVFATDFGRRFAYQCLRCGEFSITNMAEGIVERSQHGPRLSAWIRERIEGRVEVPEITSDSLKDILSTIPDYSPSQKQLIFLRNIEKRTSFPGQSIAINLSLDFPLAWASGEEELMYYLQSLIERGLLQRTDEQRNSSGSLAFKVQITPDGWNFLEQHARATVFSDQAFVAMSFSSTLKPLWESAIRPTVIKAGYKPYRVDAEPHTDRIDVRIITEIKNSRFLIADVTEQRPGVYFEAGYALGLGIPVIWSVRKDDLKNVHFDTRQYNHIVWESEAEFTENLYFFICAVVGKGLVV
jgi:nucleoside 2-deoxyribosyltransferase